MRRIRIPILALILLLFSLFISSCTTTGKSAETDPVVEAVQEGDAVPADNAGESNGDPVTDEPRETDGATTQSETSLAEPVESEEARILDDSSSGIAESTEEPVDEFSGMRSPDESDSADTREAAVSPGPDALSDTESHAAIPEPMVVIPGAGPAEDDPEQQASLVIPEPDPRDSELPEQNDTPVRNELDDRLATAEIRIQDVPSVTGESESLEGDDGGEGTETFGTVSDSTSTMRPTGDVSTAQTSTDTRDPQDTALNSDEKSDSGEEPEPGPESADSSEAESVELYIPEFSPESVGDDAPAREVDGRIEGEALLESEPADTHRDESERPDDENTHDEENIFETSSSSDAPTSPTDSHAVVAMADTMHRLKPLNTDELSRLAAAQLDGERLPIRTDDGYLALYRDFDGDGNLDVFLISATRIETVFGGFAMSSADSAGKDTDSPDTNGPGNDGEIPLSEISDPARIYDSDAPGLEFHVTGFLQVDRDLVEFGSEAVGYFKLLESAELIPIIESESQPVAVSCSFGSTQGSVVEWVVFADSEVSRLTLRERMGSTSSTRDVDDDGIIDVIISDEVFEVGIGYETYLSWLKWTGTEFELYRTDNVVRSLRSYLESAFEELKDDRIDDFSKRIGPDEPGRNTAVEPISREWLFSRLFTLADLPGNIRNESIGDARIARIVHADILENPFAQSDDYGSYFPLALRIITTERTVHLYTVRLYMSVNPFQDRRFFFAPPDGP